MTLMLEITLVLFAQKTAVVAEVRPQMNHMTINGMPF